MVNAFHVTWNKTLNDRPMPVYFSPARRRARRSTAPSPGYMGVSVTNGFNFGTGGTNPGYFNSEQLPARQRSRLGARPAPGLVRRQLDPHEDRDRQQPSEQRPVHVQRPDDRPRPGRLHARAGSAASCRATRSTTSTTTTTSAPTCRTSGRSAPNLTVNAGLRWEPYLADQELDRLRRATSISRASTPAPAARSIRRRLRGCISRATPASPDPRR